MFQDKKTWHPPLLQLVDLPIETNAGGGCITDSTCFGS